MKQFIKTPQRVSEPLWHTRISDLIYIYNARDGRFHSKFGQIDPNGGVGVLVVKTLDLVSWGRGFEFWSVIIIKA